MIIHDVKTHMKKNGPVTGVVSLQASVYSVMSDSLQPHELLPSRFLCVGFSRQKYWSGLPFPSPEHIPNPGIESTSSALQADSSH